jgi:hypothetical protein
MDDSALLDCFLNHPPLEEIPYFPLEYREIQQRQFADAELNALRQEKPYQFPMIDMGNNMHLICYQRLPTEAWKIAVPTSMIGSLINWYHITLNHIGMTRLYETIATHFHYPRLKAPVEQRVASCDVCQRNKAIGPGYGELPERDAQLLPWNEVAVDLIGPWRFSADGQELELNALTCVDPVTTLQNGSTQNRTRSVFFWAAVCVSDTVRLCGLCQCGLCQTHATRSRTVSSCVTSPISIANDRSYPI